MLRRADFAQIFVPTDYVDKCPEWNFRGSPGVINRYISDKDADALRKAQQKGSQFWMFEQKQASHLLTLKAYKFPNLPPFKDHDLFVGRAMNSTE